MERLTKPKRRPIVNAICAATRARAFGAHDRPFPEAYNVITDAVRAMGASPTEQGAGLGWP